MNPFLNSETVSPKAKAASGADLVVLVMGEICLALGLVVLLAWWTRDSSALSFLPGFVPAGYYAALMFILCGIGLLSIVFLRTALAVACAVAAAAGLLILQWDLQHLRLDLNVIGDVQTPLSQSALVVGLLMAIILALAIHFTRQAGFHAREARSANEALQEQIVERWQAQEEIKRQLRHIAALREYGQAITSTLELGAVLDALLEKIDFHFPGSGSAVRLWNRATGELEAVACRNVNEEEWKGRVLEGRRSLAKEVFASRTPLIVVNLQTDGRERDPEFARRHGLVSYLGVPLLAKGEVLGVLSFFTKEEHRFSDEEVEFLCALADQAAIAIHHSRLFEELKASKAQLEETLKIKTDFLGTMSHEMRTPLNVIMGNSSLIIDGLCGGVNLEQERRLRMIDRNARDLLRLIQGVLDITRLEQAKMPVHIEEICVEGILMEVKFEFADMAAGKGVALEVRKMGVIPQMRSDRMKLKEVLHNLVGNAVKFTMQGGVKIEARYLGEQDRVEVVVQDTGIGIAKDDLARIFDVFYQVDSSSQREVGGTGLGLNIVKGLVELLQGEIFVHSELGKGTSFCVRLPRELSTPERDSGELESDGVACRAGARSVYN